MSSVALKKLYQLCQTFSQLVLGDYKDCKDPLHTCDIQMKIPNVFNFKCKKYIYNYIKILKWHIFILPYYNFFYFYKFN